MADQIVTLWKYRDLPEALVAKSKLDSGDVACFLADENIVRLDWFYSNMIGGMRLQVAEEDVQAALELLGEEIPPNFSPEEIGEEYRQPGCPNCHSRDVTFEPFYKGLALLLLQVTNLPVWIPKNCWHCEDCGHEWEGEYE